MRKDNRHKLGSTAGGSGETRTPQAPMVSYLRAARKLAAASSNAQVNFGVDGRVRHIAATAPHGLTSLPYSGDPSKHARSFINTQPVQKALGLKGVNLEDGKVESFRFGSVDANRVEMRQTVKLADGTELPVRGGFVHVFMDDAGHVLNVTSTVKFGRKPAGLPKRMLTADQALDRSKQHLGLTEHDRAENELVLSEHDGRLNILYEVRVWVEEPRQAQLVLVRASNGEVVHSASLIRTSQTSRGQAALDRLPARGFLRIPDPDTAIADQVVDHYIEALPDPAVLSNERYQMKVRKGGKWVDVKAKADGSYNFSPDGAESSEFSAVAVFMALNEQFEYYEKLGMRKQSKPIPVFVDDPSVRDNAYFDPMGYEIHLGVGSGGSWGLAKHIAWDLGVEWHENGHHVVFLQTPGQDLPGSEGGAMHESTGDVLGQLTMQYHWGVIYGKQLGDELTVDKVKTDRRVIGHYALPPDGIRIQRNRKRTPEDKTGEVHDDGLISGGAHADLLESVIVDATGSGKGIGDGVDAFARLYLAALALVPAHRVQFTDMLHAMVTADVTLFGGHYKSLIESAHALHGIVLKSESEAQDSGSDSDEQPAQDDADGDSTEPSELRSSGRSKRGKRARKTA